MAPRGHPAGRRSALLVALALLLVLLPAASAAATNVTTAAYNNLRDDWDAAEPDLGPSQITASGFGQLFSTHLEGAIYGQPLVYENTVIVTTEKAIAYGVNVATGAVQWSRSFGQPFKASTIGCSDLKPDLGSTSTPVINPETGTVYLTTRLQTGHGVSGGRWYLQAISASDGEERPGFPVQISGTPYNTPGIPFNEGYEAQRPALLLLEGVVYVAFASDCDITPYRGIVAGYNAATGALTSMWSDESGVGTDESSQAGIWQSGGGLVSNLPGHIILATGNGVSPTPAPSDAPPDTLSESVVGLTVGAGGTLTPTQFFAPSDAPTLDQNDEDLGSGGPIALPTEYFGTKADPRLVVEVGKDGRIFLINAEDMGGYRQGAGGGDAVLQTLGPYNGVWGHPAAYGGQGGWVYVLENAGGGNLRALGYGATAGGVPQLTSVATSAESFGYTSGSPLVTSNGTATGSAVVWVIYVKNPDGGGAQLRAYDGTPSEGTLKLLWSSKIGTASKFAVPTAANGRVYVGTRNGRLIAFGSSTPPLQAGALQLGAIPVGRSRSVVLRMSVNRPLRLTGRLSEVGVEPLAGAPVQHVLGRTAGPATIPAPGTTSLSQGVLTVQQPALGRALSAGATVAVRVRFRPAHAGPVVADLTVPTSAGERTVSISGYGTAPGLLVAQGPLDYGTIDTGAGGRWLSLTFSNSWTRPERLMGIDVPGGPFKALGLPRPGTLLAPRQSLTFSVLFDPRRAGSYRSAITLRSDHGATRVAVDADARTGYARLSASTTSVNMGSVAVGHTGSVTVRVGDSGTVPLTITRAIAPESPFLAPVPVPEGISLESRTYLDVKIDFTPTARGAFSGRYLFNGTDGRGPLIVRLTGRGV